MAMNPSECSEKASFFDPDTKVVREFNAIWMSKDLNREIDELKAENEAYKVELFNQYYCEASQNGAGHQEANEYAHKRVNLINK